MKIADLESSGVLDRNSSNVKVTNLENFFNVYKDENQFYFFNLNSSLYLDFPKESLQTYNCTSDLHWSTISYILFNTVNLAWLLLKVNNVPNNKTFEKVPAGTTIYYPTNNDIITILNSMD